MFFLFLFFTLFTLVTPQNTCSINALSPATTCVYCATAGSVTIGANTTTSSPTQVLNVGLYSTTLNFGKPTPLPATQTVNMFNGSDTINIGSVGAGSAQTQTLNVGNTASVLALGTGAGSVNLGGGASIVNVGNNAVTSLSVGVVAVPLVYLGRTNPTPTPQALYLGIWSTSVEIATNTPSITISSGPTAGPVTIGQSSPTPTPTLTPQTVSIGAFSTDVRLGLSAVQTNIATNSDAGIVRIGRTATSPTSQQIQIGTRSTEILIGNDMTGDVFIGRNNIGAIYVGRVDHTTSTNFVIIGQNNPPPSPTPAPVQVVNVGRFSATVNVGENAAVAYFGIGNEKSGNEVYVGRANRPPVSSPSFLILGRASPDIIIGADSALSPTLGVQSLNIGQHSSSISIGQTQAPTSSITIGYTNPSGAPTLSTSSTISLKGRYHYFYSGNCEPNTSGTLTVLDCNVGSAGSYYSGWVTNAAVTVAPTTSGYDTTNNRWYPPEVGHYLVTFHALLDAGGSIAIIGFMNSVQVEGALVFGPSTTTGATATASMIYTFNSVGTGYYITFQGETMFTTGDVTFRQYLSHVTISRIA